MLFPPAVPNSHQTVISVYRYTSILNIGYDKRILSLSTF